jgi:hypothetical protein
MKDLALTAAIFALALPSFALDGDVRIHDPSTIVQCYGKYYTYGTGGSCLVSDSPPQATANSALATDGKCSRFWATTRR